MTLLKPFSQTASSHNAEIFTPAVVPKISIQGKRRSHSHDGECKRTREAVGIVRFSSTTTRHCNNSKTAIFLAYPLGMHVRGGSPYISPSAVESPTPAARTALFRVGYFIGKEHTWRPSRRYRSLFVHRSRSGPDDFYRFRYRSRRKFGRFSPPVIWRLKPPRYNFTVCLSYISFARQISGLLSEIRPVFLLIWKSRNLSAGKIFHPEKSSN